MRQEPWTIQLFGGLRAQQADTVITRFNTHKTGGLLAYLAHYCHRSHPREELVGLFWPDADPEAGRISLRSALTALRKQLEPEGISPETVLFADRQFVQLLQEALCVDTREFER